MVGGPLFAHSGISGWPFCRKLTVENRLGLPWSRLVLPVRNLDQISFGLSCLRFAPP